VMAATVGEQLTKTRGNWRVGDAPASATVRGLHVGWLMMDGGLWRTAWQGGVSSMPA